ncbi:MAG: hypothetical protein AMJ64_14270 [Betaproteobacteria bacterium SG8_39]|nr:MAG: hypothetical protein AMJ64_14270 [Betaproteobacteria bacterium SG8_39]
MLRALHDAGPAAAILAAGLGFLAYLLAFPAQGVSQHVSPTTLPTVLAACLVVLGALMLLRAVRRPRDDAPPEAPRARPHGGNARVLLLLASCGGYVALLPLAGYLLSTALFVGATAWLFGNRRPLSIVLLMIIVPAVLLVFFEKFMIIPLPGAALLG